MWEKKRRAHEGEIPHISPVVLHQLNFVIERVVVIKELLEQFQLGVWYLVLKKEGDLKQEDKTVGIKLAITYISKFWYCKMRQTQTHRRSRCWSWRSKFRELRCSIRLMFGWFESNCALIDWLWWSSESYESDSSWEAPESSEFEFLSGCPGFSFSASWSSSLNS